MCRVMNPRNLKKIQNFFVSRYFRENHNRDSIHLLDKAFTPRNTGEVAIWVMLLNYVQNYGSLEKLNIL